MSTELGDLDEFVNLDRTQALTNNFPGAAPYKLMDWRDKAELPFYISPVWRNSFASISSGQNRISELNNVDIVFTSDKNLWSRCPVIETRSEDFAEPAQLNPPFTVAQSPIMFDTRAARSVTKEAGPDGKPAIDQNIDPSLNRGMGWFPGYAVDVETGERLAIFFGENSVYDGRTVGQDGFRLTANGGDMMWNPNDTLVYFPPNSPITALNFPSGGQHFIYVTRLPYDEGVFLESRLEFRGSGPQNLSRKTNAIREITWAVFPFLTPGERLLSYADGLIPNKATLRLRVDSKYDVAVGEPAYNGHGAYQFSINGKMPNPLNATLVERWLEQINIVPNPYYGSSAYEDRTSVFDKVIKITNLPARAVVTIYSLDGKFIRQYNRDEQPAVLPGSATRPIGTRQVSPALDWDLNNFRGIPVASGVYLVHVDAFELGERTLKLFMVNRQFDPAGL
ncbi:MAG: hypothetical protein HC821_00595 [Lewinella sp.]|nr:hypothetical protein [Lewinella sp.]